MTRFEEIIDLEIFRALLEGFLRGWGGAFNVMPADPPPDYLFPESKEHFIEFCRRVRSAREGEKLCFESNRKLARKAAEEGKPVWHICHAGLLDIAVPIIVKGELIATILCGQRKSWNEAEEKEGRRRAEEAESQLGFPPGKLLALREQAPMVTEEQLDDVKNRLWRVATHISTLGLEKLELEEKRDELNYRLRESEEIQQIMGSLAEIVELDRFWLKIDDVLLRLCHTIGASCAALLVYDRQDKTPPIVKSVAGLRREVFIEKSYPFDDPVIKHLLRRRGPKIMKFNPSTGGTICRDVYELSEHKSVPDQVALIPFALSGEHDACIVFFIQKGVKESLAIEKEMSILSRAAPQIAIAFQNCRLFTEQKRVVRERDSFFEEVSHQLIAPLSGLQATSQRLLDHYYIWDAELIKNRLTEIRNMSRWAARLTRNFAWVVRTGGVVLRKRWTNMVGLLIGCARDVQGLAATKGVQVHVDEESVNALPKLEVDRDLLIQAVVNLLDNAVKYADDYTEVVISAFLAPYKVGITITDYGIPVKKEDVNKSSEDIAQKRRDGKSLPEVA